MLLKPGAESHSYEPTPKDIVAIEECDVFIYVGGENDAWVEDIALKSALERLSDRERRIIRLRFFNGRTQMEIAEEIGISQAQVSRLEKAALDKIRRMM